MDARPFFKLCTPSGTARCLRPDFNARSVGIGASEGGLGVVSVSATHSVMVFAPLPAGLKKNAVVTLDDTSPPGRYRVLQIAPDPAGATVYLAADPAETRQPYEPARPAEAPRASQRIPYVATDRQP